MRFVRVENSVEGPGEVVGENPFALDGGCGAVWLKAKEAAGTIRLTAPGTMAW